MHNHPPSRLSPGEGRGQGRETEGQDPGQGRGRRHEEASRSKFARGPSKKTSHGRRNAVGHGASGQHRRRRRCRTAGREAGFQVLFFFFFVLIFLVAIGPFPAAVTASGSSHGRNGRNRTVGCRRCCIGPFAAAVADSGSCPGRNGRNRTV